MPLYRAQSGFDASKIDDAFSSLAKAFAPPTAQEMLAGAKVKEIRDQQARIAELYGNPNDPNFDRRAIAAGLQTGTTSLYAVDQNNATSRFNNTADNARALQQTRLQQQGDTTRTLLAPVGQNATRFVPPTIADAYGLPATQVGAVDLKPGEQVALPDGRTLSGAPKPMTMDEVKAATFATLPPEQQAAITFGATPVQAVQTPAGPRNVTSLGSLGQEPVADTTKAQLANYQTPDGKSGTARFDPASGWVDSQNNVPLPAGSKTFSASLQGDAAATGLGQTTRNGIQGQLVDLANLESVVSQFDDLIKRDPAAIGTTGRVLGFGQDVAATSQEVMGLLSPKMQQLAKDAERGLVDPEVMAKNFNPNIPQAQLLENLLVAQLAKVNDPNGRLSNQAMDQTRAALGGGGWFQNAQRTRASLDGIRQQIAAKRQMYGAIEPAAAAIGSGGVPAAPPQAPTAPTAPAAPGTRRRFNPATGQIE